MSNVLGVKTKGDHVRTYPEVIADLKAEIARLRVDVSSYRDACANLTLDNAEKGDEIAKLQAIIDKQLY